MNIAYKAILCLSLATVLLSVTLFAIFVWPTRYRYEHAYTTNRLVRIDRFNGKSWMLTHKGSSWGQDGTPTWEPVTGP